jgi:hypothetical protein
MISVYQCKCKSIAQLLVSNGLFPMAPRMPRRAVSIMLLDFYRAIYEKSSDAISAFSGALHNHYDRRGFPLKTAKVQDYSNVTCACQSNISVGNPYC